VVRYNYARLHKRSARLANALWRLGIGSGDCVISLAWNTHRHLELFFAVPSMGAILHTANPRFSEDQIPSPFGNGGIRYESFIGAEPPSFAWPDLDERSAAFLCYTSGTIGAPKGVLYSHRSVFLHAISAGLAGVLGFDPFDCIMPCQSLYHATAWGLPFTAAIIGCKLVLPCDKFDGASLQELIQGEGVPFSGGVPTIWTMYLDYPSRSLRWWAFTTPGGRSAPDDRSAARGVQHHARRNDGRSLGQGRPLVVAERNRHSRGAAYGYRQDRQEGPARPI
jgi:3-(methylthio)propionyl---CoA ligase